MLDKSIERRLRRTAERRGLMLVKSARRDPCCPWFGRWAIVERLGSRVVVCRPGDGWALVASPAGAVGLERFATWLTLEDVARLLDGGLAVIEGELVAPVRRRSAAPLARGRVGLVEVGRAA